MAIKHLIHHSPTGSEMFEVGKGTQNPLYKDCGKVTSIKDNTAETESSIQQCYVIYFEDKSTLVLENVSLEVFNKSS